MAKPAKPLYDKISGKYHENRPLDISDHTELPTVVSLAGNVRATRVLDAGCGHVQPNRCDPDFCHVDESFGVWYYDCL